MKKRQLIIQVFLIGLVFALFAFFRFYNLDKRIIFDWDQERDANIIKQLLIDHKPTLIGPRVISESGFFLGPYFIYLLTPFYLLTNLHPQGLIYFINFYNIIFFALSYLILKKIYGLHQFLIFLFLWTVNFLLIEYDIIPWNPVFIPLGVVVTWLILYRIFKNNAVKDWLFLGLVLGFFVNMHFQFIFMILFSAFFLILYQIKKKAFDFKKIVVAKLSFLAMFIPLLIFDLRHNFLNTHALINFFFSQGVRADHDPNVWFTVFTYFLQPLIYLTSELLVKLLYFVLLLIIFYLCKKKEKFHKLFYYSTLFLWLVFPLFFILYGKRPSEYYFVFLYPFIFISFIDFIFTFKKNYVAYFLILLLSICSIQNSLSHLKTNIFSLYYKDLAIKELKKLTENKKFNISFDTSLGANSGYRYLIDYYQIKQTGNWSDPLVQIRIPPKEGDIHIQEIGIKIPQELKTK